MVMNYHCMRKITYQSFQSVADELFGRRLPYMFKKKLTLIFKLSISGLLAVYLTFQVNWQIIYQSFNNVSICLYILSVILTLISIYCLAWKYNLLIRNTAIEHSIPVLAKIQLISQFYALFIPSALGPAAVRWYKVTKNQSGRAMFLASTIFERSAFIFMLLFFGMIPLFFYTSNQGIADLKTQILPFVILIFGIIIFIFSYFMSIQIQTYLKSHILKLLPTKWHTKLSTILNDNFLLKDPGPSLFIKILFLSLLWQVFFLLRLYFLFQAARIPLTIVEVAWMGSLVLLLQIIPVSFAGIGVREGAYAYLFALFGLPPEQGVLIGILFFTQMILIAAVGGILEITDK